MEVLIYNTQNDLVIDPEWAGKIVSAVLEDQKVVCDQVILHFVGRKKMEDLHLEFFNDPALTDCISFPIDNPKESSDFCLLGEIFICPMAALEYVKKRRGNDFEEIALYIIHGLLHLLGYDDLSVKDRTAMRRQERRYIKKLPQILSY